MLATREFKLKPALVTLVELPLVLPPAAAGIALLAALGPHGIAGGLLDDAGITLVLTTAGVVVAMTFVASPFYIRQAQAAFESLDPGLLDAARTLGASEGRRFIRVAIPLARNGLLAGGALAWGRALGEFGATLMFAGSLRGVTQTAPLALYERFATDFNAAIALAVVLLAVSAAVLVAVKLFTRSEANAPRPA
jgi:molybdate transport system permease protein